MKEFFKKIVVERLSFNLSPSRSLKSFRFSTRGVKKHQPQKHLKHEFLIIYLTYKCKLKFNKGRGILYLNTKLF